MSLKCHYNKKYAKVNSMKIDKDLILKNNFSWNSNKGLFDAGGNNINLSGSEFKTLELLFSHVDIPIDTQTIYEEVFFDSDREYNIRTIRNIISSLRKKLPQGTIENIYGSAYIIRKHQKNFDTQNILEEYLMDIIDQANNGITITDPNQEDDPIIYCNKYFLKVFGYEKDEVIGRNARFLRADDQQEDVIVKIRTALIEQVPITVRIRNYTKNGNLVPTELTISPIFERDTGKLQFFLGIQKVLESYVI